MADTERTERAEMTDLDKIVEFMKAGKAVFTIQRPSGERATFKVTPSKPRFEGDTQVHFVKLLTGPDNSADYRFFGTIFPGGRFVLSPRSGISPTAKSAVLFADLMTQIEKEAGELRFYHEGKCGRCGRRLTVPESIQSGFGPECIGKLMS